MSDADISTLTTAYTVPAGSEARLTASFCNRSTSATATLQLWVVPQGESRGDQHLKESGTTLGLAGTAQAVLERSFVAPAGCIVYVQASTANVSCQVQGDLIAISTSSTSAISDGTSSIVWGTNWVNYGSRSWVKKTYGTTVEMYLEAYASGAVGSTILTLPSGYRPSSQISVPGFIYDFSANSFLSASVTIDTSGVVTSAILGSNPVSPPSSFDLVYSNFSFIP